MLERLQNHRARALASDEALAVEVERTGSAQGVFFTRKSAEVREARDADGVHAFLRAARKRHVGVAVADVAHGLPDAVGARRARGDDVDALAFHAVANRQVACGDIADHRGYEQRAHTLRALLEQRLEPALELVDAADAAAEDDRHARRVLVLHGKARLRDRLVRGDDRVLHEALEAARLLLREAVLGGIEAADLASIVDLVVGRVEALDGADAAFAAHDRLPQRLHADTRGRDRAHAGNHDAVRSVGSLGVHGCLAHSAIPPSMQIT